MKLFDSHCHLDDGSYDEDLEAVLERAAAADVKAMMIAGINRAGADKVIALAGAHADIFAAVGVHPHDTAGCSDADITALKALTQHPKVKAWGEIGLDFNRMFSPRADQEHWLERQLEAAAETRLPCIFHERDTSGRFLEMLQARFPEEQRGVVHCFSGNREELAAYLDLGLYIGITGIVTILKRGQALREMVPHIPVTRLLIETDAPYLTPAPQKNKCRRNEPAFVRSVLLKLAEILNRPPEDLAAIIWENTCRFYGIEESGLGLPENLAQC